MDLPNFYLERKRQKSNYKRILAHLQKHGKETNFGMERKFHGRWHARIDELRKDGYIIVANRLNNDGLWEYIYKGHKDDEQA